MLKQLRSCWIGVFVGLCSHMTWTHANVGHGADPFVRIASPSEGFATNASTLQVAVRYRSDGDAARLRLWLDGAVVGSFDTPRKSGDRSHTFAVDVSAHRDAVVRLQADLVRKSREKEHKSSRHRDEDEHDRDTQARSRTVVGVLDKTPPLVAIRSPLGNQIVEATSVEVRGSARDNFSGIVSLSVNGARAPAAHGHFAATVALPFSVNPITVTATDRAGNTTTVERSVIQSSEPAPGPALLSTPPSGALVGKALQYQIVAASSDPAGLAFSLSAAPAGMVIDAASGLIRWTPAPDQAGDHPVAIAVTDPKGQASQSFTLSVFGSRPVASARITAAGGGVITVDDPASSIQGLSINIPAGALLADTTIEVSELVAPPTLGGTSRFFLKGFSVEPDNTLLSAPATISIPYSTSEFKSGQGITVEEFLGTYFLDAATGISEGLASFSVDTTNHVMSGSVPHFSVYYVTNAARLCPPRTAQSQCPDVVPAPSAKIPAIVVHGFQPYAGADTPVLSTLASGMGDELTWGELRPMLGKRGVPAWRFDWDSRDVQFEMSAARLAAAIALVKGTTAPPHKVNLLAHSFGGILARTYLQDRGLHWPYRHDVNRLMTLGTPHQGIGGALSTIYADNCIGLTTCSQTATGRLRLPGTTYGDFLRRLNSVPPTLPSDLLYYVITGRQFEKALFSNVVRLVEDDGLITVSGASLCQALAAGCPGSIRLETLPSTVLGASGLCHTSALCKSITGVSNVPMAEVNSESHPLWEKICTFLEIDASACKKTKIDFEEVDTTSGFATGAAVTEYLAGFGVTTPNSPSVINTVFYAPYIRSPTKNIMTSGDGRNPTILTLNFQTPVSNVSFVRAGVVGALSPSGTIAGTWTATAYDEAGNQLASVGEGLVSFYGDRAAATFVLNGRAISRVVFSGFDFGFAGINVPHITNIDFGAQGEDPLP
jgi:Glucodextranase, domain B/Putative Ig domain/PGAP1-like protein